jgi:hypothetical protein
MTLTKQEQDFEEFQDWIEKRFNQPSTQSWTKIILFFSEDESDALDIAILIEIQTGAY